MTVTRRPDMARTSHLPKRPAPGTAPRQEAMLTGAALLQKMRPPGLRERVFACWLGRAVKGDSFIYHLGELARDALGDADLAQLAEVIRRQSTGFFPVVSGCGHERGSVTGSGRVELLTRREFGETVYLARMR